MRCGMTSLTIHIPDDLAKRAKYAGLFSEQALCRLLESAVSHYDNVTKTNIDDVAGCLNHLSKNKVISLEEMKAAAIQAAAQAYLQEEKE